MNISTSVMSSLLAEIIFTATIPLLIMFYLGFKHKGKVFPFFAGLATYVFFAIELESVILSMAVGSSSHNSAAAYAILSGLFGAVFEAGGVWLAFKLLSKAYPRKGDALAFGAGFSWIESIVVTGLSAFMSFSYASVVNELGTDAFIESFSDMEEADPQAILDSLAALTASSGYAECLQRVLALIFDLSLALILFTAVSKSLNVWLGVAAGLKFIYCIPGALVSYGSLTNGWITLLIMAVPTAAASYLAVGLYKAYDSGRVGLKDIL